VIAHVGGVPIEETLVQVAPALGAAALAVGLALERVLSRVRRLDPRRTRDRP
jgi:hypothetical protein